jgi:hypothetical protein
MFRKRPAAIPAVQVARMGIGVLRQRVKIQNGEAQRVHAAFRNDAALVRIIPSGLTNNSPLFAL